MQQDYDARLHINEEPRNDFSDTFNGFGGMFAVLAVIFLIMVIIKFMIE